MNIKFGDDTSGTHVGALQSHPLTSDMAETMVDRQQMRRRGLYDWRQLVGGASMFMGMTAIMIAWYAIGGEDSVWRQLPYVTSGGIGGAGLIAIGVTLLVSYEHSCDRDAIASMRNAFLGRIDELEGALSAVSHEVSLLRESNAIDLRESAPKAAAVTAAPRRAPRRKAPVRISQ